VCNLTECTGGDRVGSVVCGERGGGPVQRCRLARAEERAQACGMQCPWRMCGKKIGDDPGLEREREEEEHGPAWEEINGLGPTRTVSFLIYSK
jgi:hypothetical protein